MAADAFSLGCLLRYIFTGVPPQHSVDGYISKQNNSFRLKLIALFQCVGEKIAKRDLRYRKNDMVPEYIGSIIGALSCYDTSQRISVRACLRLLLTPEEIQALPFSLGKITFLHGNKNAVIGSSHVHDS